MLSKPTTTPGINSKLEYNYCVAGAPLSALSAQWDDNSGTAQTNPEIMR